MCLMALEMVATDVPYSVSSLKLTTAEKNLRYYQMPFPRFVVTLRAKNY